MKKIKPRTDRQEGFFRSNYLVVDFETTGLTEKDWPVSMGWVIVTKGGCMLLPGAEVLIRLPLRARIGYYSGKAFDMHKIHFKTARRLGVSPKAALHLLYTTVRDVVPDCHPLKETFKFAAQNVAFDWQFFKKLHRMADFTNSFDYHLMDIPTLGHALLGVDGSKGLSEALGVENEGPHIARLDAQMSARMLVKLLVLEKKYRIPQPVSEIEEFKEEKT